MTTMKFWRGSDCKFLTWALYIFMFSKGAENLTPLIACYPMSQPTGASHRLTTCRNFSRQIYSVIARNIACLTQSFIVLVTLLRILILVKVPWYRHQVWLRLQPRTVIISNRRSHSCIISNRRRRICILLIIRSSHIIEGIQKCEMILTGIWNLI